MSRFIIHQTPMEGVRVIQRHPIRDRRGYFERVFCEDDFRAIIADRRIVQINHTLTARTGTVRGLHFQRHPHGEMKLISCLRGEVFDVAVDLRWDSPTFLQWHAETLSAENHKMLAIAEGIAHGFQALSDDCDLLYLHTAAYESASEGGLNVLDPRLAIEWPLPVSERSSRDQAYAFLGDNFKGISP